MTMNKPTVKPPVPLDLSCPADEDCNQSVTRNLTRRPYREDFCVPQLVANQAFATPEAPALASDTAVLTYRELNARANQLAHHLRSLGVGPDVPVGLCLPRSVEMIVGALGILKAGGAYLPL